MSRSPEQVAAKLSQLITPGVRDSLLARGLARGTIWRDGVVPPEATKFSSKLTDELLDHGFAVLRMALELRDSGQFLELVDAALEVAGEAIESVARRGDPTAVARGFYTICAAAAFHIGHFAARSYVLLPDPAAMNLSAAELGLAYLMRRDVLRLREHTAAWLQDPGHTDEQAAQRIASPDDPFDTEALVALALDRQFHAALASFDFALMMGNEAVFQSARTLFLEGVVAARETGAVTYWWIFALARHLGDDLWMHSLHARLPIDGPQLPAAWPALRRVFITSQGTRRRPIFDLWPSQLEAASRSMDPTDDLVVALPTSAGKTRIAELCILRALADGRRVVYVTPLRALSAQLERLLGETFRPLGASVSSLYGASGVGEVDIAELAEHTIVVATPEKLDFALRQQPEVLNDVGLVVLDEGHMIGLGTREIRYEVLVQRLLRRDDAVARRIVCLSAIFSSGPAFDDFTAWLRSDSPGKPIQSSWRPTRQRFGIVRRTSKGGWLELRVGNERPYVPRFVQFEPPRKRRRTSFPNTDQEYVFATAKRLLDDGHLVLLYCPEKDSVGSFGKLALKLAGQEHFATVLQKDADIDLVRALGREWLGENHVAVKALDLGIALHHGSLPRPYLTELERTLAARTLRLMVTSPTLAQGVDLACSALVFNSLYRAGEPIKTEEFTNVVGRAGRAYVDLDGLTLLPAKESWQEGVFWKFVADMTTRSLESGILELVRILAERLLAHLGNSEVAFKEYVLNYGGNWFADATGASSADEAIPMAELDSTILATVEDLNATPPDLAKALDVALKSSLWERRIAKQPAQAAERQRAFLLGRAAWLWRNTTAEQRASFYASGVGFSTGQFLEQNLDALYAALHAANSALVEKRLDDAIVHTQALAEQLLAVYPFGGRKMPVGWKDILASWLRGMELGKVVNAYGDEAIDFLQNRVVYGLVWGVEAVRLHAKGRGLDTEEHAGLLPLALTYGLPSHGAIQFALLGLPSRVLAQRVAALAGESNLISPQLLRHWLRDKSTAIDTGDWSNPERVIWESFMKSMPRRRNGTLLLRNRELTTIWLPGKTPSVGMPVRATRLAPEDWEIASVQWEPLGHGVGTVDHDARVLGGHVGAGCATVVLETLEPAEES